MAVGLSTYAYFWRLSEAAPTPVTLAEAVAETRELGGDVFQICDHPPVEGLSPGQLTELRRVADDLGVRLELGTRGVRPEHLLRYLDIAEALGATFVRSMLNTADHRPTVEEAVAALGSALPAFEERGVTLGLETYEQVSTTDLLRVVNAVNNPRLGVCLDPANSVARLEQPTDVVDRTADRVVNIHVKDFTFTRSPGWVGFSLTGCPLGTGLLDYHHMIGRVRPAEKNINQIVEHWLPWQGTFEETARLEDQWTRHNIEFLRSE
ncbi:sugar phosphate isomerase/epimerase family protein [Actinoalloteichus caeruleus]|uniref:Sugar phosphate isomerase/epimerase n=1 Tax=Actinoalloteichus caeruleus DSM 43889 TaxID=1120930 RepID=A0ABT1JGL2_ACTCY|nr:sugar phosphate isomerase/epimerase family protein [Actinoalloteichus caeruleus]MCP2331652.1 Sugar phosphate isomerase/epimerase [Actinoalloteichus caeruleus DSM 43889]